MFDLKIACDSLVVGAGHVVCS